MKKSFLLTAVFSILNLSLLGQIIIGGCIDPSKICSTCFCILLYDPVCGCDGKVYSNSCFAQINGVTFWTPYRAYISISGPSEICQSEKVTLTASGGSDYIWSTGEKTASIVVSPESTTYYSVEGANVQSICKSRAAIWITVNPKYMDKRDITINQGDTIKVRDYKHYKTGVYYDTLKTYRGCDSIIITNLKVDLTTDMKRIPELFENHFIKTYPNPAGKFLNVESDGLVHSVEFFSLNGTLLQNQKVNNKEIVVNLDGYYPGIYILKIYSDKSITTRKIVVE